MGDDTHYEAAGDERHQNAMASERQANEVIKHIPLFGEVYGGVSAAVYQGIGEFEESEKRGTEVGDGALRDAQAAVDAAWVVFCPLQRVQHTRGRENFEISETR